MLKEMNLKVTEELAVTVLPNSDYEFLMTTKEVAHGYGVTEYNIRQHKLQHSDELIEGKHYVIAVSIPNGELKIKHNAVLWTKRGIVRLGFFIKSERAKLFRDWAEDLIIAIQNLNAENFLQPVPVLPAPKKRNHNRLSQERLVGILADVAKIDDRDLRLSLISKLGV